MYTIVGIENVSYKSKKTGEQVKGTRLHLSYEHEDVEGCGVETVFCNSSIDLEGLEVGDQVVVFYNKFGRVTGISVQDTIQ